MRSRRPHNPWPAMADSMMIIALVLGAALVHLASKTDDSESLRLENARLKADNLELRAEVQRLNKTIEELQLERAKNADMFKAIQTSEELVQDLQSRLKLPEESWGDDQSLRFGDDLIHFRSGDSNVIWQPGSRDLMRNFCSTLSELLDKPFKEGAPAKRSEFFTVMIEGHTDSQLCDGSDRCNWYLSGQRAAAVRAEMQKPSVCPGGAGWNLIPMAMAASKRLVAPDNDPASRLRNRRIELRVVPNYSEIISRPSGEEAERTVQIPIAAEPPQAPRPRPAAPSQGRRPPQQEPETAPPSDARPEAPRTATNLRAGRFTMTSTRPIPPNSLTALSDDELSIMGNEIFARHGQIFVAGGAMDRHFSKQAWYKPSRRDVSSDLSPLEWANIRIIRAEIERRRVEAAPTAPPP